MQRRKDNKGRVLKDGEVYRKSDGLYMYRWTAKNGKRHTIYDATLEGLREKEEKIQHDLADGLRIPECSLTLNDLFELWRKNKGDEQSSFTKCKSVVKSQGAAFHDAVFARGLELHYPWPCKDL